MYKKNYIFRHQWPESFNKFLDEDLYHFLTNENILLVIVVSVPKNGMNIDLYLLILKFNLQ